MNNQEDKGRLENKSKPNKKGNRGEKEKPWGETNQG